jgi:very-short-patch-repair endonuclease/RecA/RadA recombinase
LSPLLNALPSSAADQALVIGYPVQAYYRKKEDEPDVTIIRPVFFFAVEHAVSRDGLLVSCEDPRPEVNLGWLDYTFSRKPDRQRSFLSACGFINRWRPNDEAPGLERGELAPSLDNLVSALTAFMPERVQQPLELNNVPDHPLREPFETGIYNRAVLMLAKRTKYNATLLKELAVIEKAPDEVLDSTALRYVFTRSVDEAPAEAEELLHESVVADTTLLNAEQRRATASLLTKNVTVVTGPPGTGKSQIVSSAVANARLRGQTVLFASRNHKAIDAVIGRLSDTEGRSLIVRTNSKDDPNLNFTFAHAIRNMLAEQRDLVASERLKRAKEELDSLLEERGIQASYIRRITEVGTALGEREERMSYLARELPEVMIIFLDAQPRRFPVKAVCKLARIVRTFRLQTSDRSFSARVFDLTRSFLVLPWFRVARRKLHRVPGFPQLPTLPAPKTLKALLSELPTFERAMAYARLRSECLSYEARISELPSVEETTKAVVELSGRIEEVASRATSLDLDSRCGLPAGADREELSGLRAALNAMRTGLEEGFIRAETVRVLAERTPHILQIFPCWAVTNLSAGSRIPLVAGMFDLCIVDEASQSDIPSAIPILYRARRAGVVGDPFQLTHTSKLSTARDTMLRRQVGLKRVEDVRFAYTESSLYDLFASTRGVEPVFLSETYRSAADIADYSNTAFYNGRLRVATDHSRLVSPRGASLGIHWTQVIGEVQSGGGSGCYCREEVNEVVRIVRTMLLDNNFRGTLGVVTPFRHQANRLRDALFESEMTLYEALIRAQAHVDTAHGFQGDERDVIVFSLCAGPGMPGGSLSFLRESGNLFNVAVSRARAVLHVVGNQDWARRCGIRHIEQLASLHARKSVPQAHGPWHPHESPWEEKLYKTLVEAGLEPRPQFPVSGRRLDLALVRQGAKPLKIDIEVDGDCHRNPDGTRKIDDLWRDIQLQGLGWKVMRFWTYQLREDMAGCVDKIRKEWRRHERRDA